MKNLTRSSLRPLTAALGLWLLAGLFACPSPATAQLYWDPGLTASSGGGGPGTWSTAANWFNGSVDTTWTAGDTANFGGSSGGTVTLGAAENADGLTFTTTGYTLSGSTLTLGGTAPTITVPSGGAETISNILAGSAGLTVSGSGTLTLSATNTYTGGTTNSSGATLTIGGAGKLGGGSYSGAIDNAGTFNYNSSASQTLSGIMSDVGALVVSKGTLTLSAADSYSGGTTIAPGATLILASGGKLNSSGAITNNSAFEYNNPNSWTLNGPISGAGELIVNPGAPGSLLYLYGANTYSGLTELTPYGQVIITNDSNLGTPPSSYKPNQLEMFYGFLNVQASTTLNKNRGIDFISGEQGVGGSIQVSPGCTLTIAAPIIGAYAWICGSGEPQYGGGTNLLATTNAYTGGTALSTGRLLLGTNGALPYATTLVMAPDDFGGPFFDLGGYSQTIGPLSTTNSFIGSSGLGTPTIVLSGALTVVQTNTATAFSGQIIGSGSLTINGNSSGKLILSNYPNAYTGGTLINGGTLEIGAGGSSLVGNVSVNGGTNQLDNNTALSAGTVLNIAPGGTVNLNYTGAPQTIGALNFGATPQATGLWGAVGNAGATYTSSQFTGTGLLLVCPTPDQTITAASSVCAGSTNTASVPVTAGATYAWSVNNATIVSGGASSTVAYAVSALSPVVLSCVVTSTCGTQTAGGQNTNVVVNTCWQVVDSTNVIYNSTNGATITGAGLIGAGWALNASTDLSAPFPWPTIQTGTITSSPFTILDSTALSYPQQFYYLTNSP